MTDATPDQIEHATAIANKLVPLQVHRRGPEWLGAYAAALAAIIETEARVTERAAPSWAQFNYADPVQAVRTRDSAPEFPGFVIGWYQRLDGHRGYVLQHDPHRIVHVYPEKAVETRSGEQMKEEG